MEIHKPQRKLTVRLSQERYMTELEKAFSGEWFKAGNPVLKQEREKARALCYQLNQCNPSDRGTRSAILAQLIGSARGSFEIFSPFYCDYGKYITLGDRFFANYTCTILDGAAVTFGDDVRIGPNCTFCTINHAMEPQRRNEGYQIFKPITVGNNVWFGAGVIVLPGVTIGDNTVIGAGSVVTRDIPAGVFAAGNPCRVIRSVETE
jgi:acetyltransferase-like isoleucine patch superfamily enzyme